MRWSATDGIRFGIDLSALIADNRHADDLLEMLTERVEDTLSIYGVPCDALAVPLAMNRMFRFLHSKRGRVSVTVVFAVVIIAAANRDVRRQVWPCRISLTTARDAKWTAHAMRSCLLSQSARLPSQFIGNAPNARSGR
jgi:hypothetical protein